MESNSTIVTPIIEGQTTQNTTGSYSVSFTRLFSTSDPLDTNLTLSNTPIFWIYGRVENNQLIIVRSSEQFGTSELNLVET